MVCSVDVIGCYMMLRRTQSQLPGFLSSSAIPHPLLHGLPSHRALSHKVWSPSNLRPHPGWCQGLQVMLGALFKVNPRPSMTLYKNRHCRIRVLYQAQHTWGMQVTAGTADRSSFLQCKEVSVVRMFLPRRGRCLLRRSEWVAEGRCILQTWFAGT